MKSITALALAITLATGMTGCVTPPTPSQAGAGWAGTWGASPTIPITGSKGYENQTLRQVVRLSQGGQSFRIRFTNEYGDKPLNIGAATLALAGPDGKLLGTPIVVSFSGQTSTIIPTGAPLLSDPIRLDAKALDSLSISLFLPMATGPCTCHFAGTATTWISSPGDFTRTSFEAKETSTSRAFISAVEVETVSPRTIVTFGDSITDGTASTNNANRRWPDVLADRLVAAGQATAISNQAIAGNRVLTQQAAIFGANALARFDRDISSVPNAKWLIVLEGVNDIGAGGASPPSADQIIAGYRQLVARSHARGIKVYFATVLPYEGARYFLDVGEAVRGQVNTWIRTSGEPDGVIDFDAAMKDPANPRKMKAELQSGDWLHPNDAGYKVMGEAIDLALFK
ncbi:MAG: SGNH/GDSL hydrolase family protein [Hyphomonadaceae bacterium]